jgi:hypothetical protein
MTSQSTPNLKCSHCGFISRDLPDNCQGCGRTLQLRDIGYEIYLKSPRERSEVVNTWIFRKAEALAKADAENDELYKSIIGFIRNTTISEASRGRVAVETQRLAESSIFLGMKREDIVANPAGFVAQACSQLGQPDYKMRGALVE